MRDLTHAPGLPSFEEDRPRAFAEDSSGNVWIGFNNALTRYSQGTFTSFAAPAGLPPGAIMDILVDHSGRVWLASARSGLVRVDASGAGQPGFASYAIGQGLSSNNTAVITEDLRGYIYVGGGNGLDRLDPATGRVKHFSTADGLPTGVFLDAFRDRHGVLWFGMSSGLARLEPAVDMPSAPPTVLVTAMRVSGTPQPISALGERDLSLPDLPPDHNQVEIDFVGLSFRPGDVLRYQYRLDGADADWSTPGDQRTVAYARVAPGRYTFLVRAVNSDGIVSDRPASIAFTILHPIWLRWWFLTLGALALGATVHAAYRYRVARLLEMANMRTRIATDLHDDIGANLTRIALLSVVANRTRGGEPAHEAAGPLVSIASIARESVAAMSDIVWAINPKRETLLDLTRRMRQHAAEIFTLRGIALRFDAPAEQQGLKLSVDVRRDLLLIFKEVVNNAVRHSQCSRVEIDFHVQESRLVLVVVDNGKGFDPSIESEGQGLSSMKRRARRLGGTLEIASSENAGTRVTVSIPL